MNEQEDERLIAHETFIECKYLFNEIHNIYLL
jgi:hypothetical protein